MSKIKNLKYMFGQLVAFSWDKKYNEEDAKKASDYLIEQIEINKNEIKLLIEEYNKNMDEVVVELKKGNFREERSKGKFLVRIRHAISYTEEKHNNSVDHFVNEIRKLN